MAELVLPPALLAGEGWEHYRLLDSGHGRKFESYGAANSHHNEAGLACAPWPWLR